MGKFSRQTVFDRPIDLYILNNTDKNFTLYNTDLQSGILEVYPPNSMSPGEDIYFKGQQSGLIGSSGFITYKTQIQNLIVYVSFYWSHPEGNIDSIYYGYSSPFGTFFVTPRNNFDISQKPTNQQHNVKDWITNDYSDQYMLTMNPPGINQSITYLLQYGLGHTVS